MIELDEIQLAMVKQILKRHVPSCEVRAFGSRVNGTPERFSDLDLAVVAKEKLDWQKLEALKDAFSESDLAIMIDVHDYHALSKSFQQIVDQNFEVIQKANH